MADVASLSGLTLPADPTSSMEAPTVSYLESRVPGTLSEAFVYDDKFATLNRREAVTPRPPTLGLIYVFAGVASDRFSATKLRLYCSTASAGTGTFQASVYWGTSSSSLSRLASITTQSSVAVGLREYTLSPSAFIVETNHIAISILTTGFTTIPQFLGQAGSPPSALINATPGRLINATSATTSNTTLPSGFNMSSGYNGYGIQWWMALAP